MNMSVLMRGVGHLYGAGHGAEGEDGGTVFYSGLVIEGSLSVHQHHCHLQEQRQITVRDKHSMMESCV